MNNILYVTEEVLEGSNGASINSKGTYNVLSSLGKCDLISGRRFPVHELFSNQFNRKYDLLWLRGLSSTLVVEGFKKSFTVYDINGIVHEEHKLKGGTNIECKLLKYLQKCCANSADLVKVHTENMKKYFLDIGVSPNFIKIPPIIDISQYSYVKKNFDSGSKINVGYSGNAREWQGLSILLKAFESLKETPNLSLSLIGPSESDIPVVSNNISLLNKCSHNTYISEVLPNFDIFVVPRPSNLVTETTTPIKLIEAMASGVPVIASDVGGINEYVKHKRDVFLVEPNNSDALANAILHLCENPKLALKLSENARVTAEETFDYTRIGAKLKKLI